AVGERVRTDRVALRVQEGRVGVLRDVRRDERPGPAEPGFAAGHDLAERVGGAAELVVDPVDELLAEDAVRREPGDRESERHQQERGGEDAGSQRIPHADGSFRTYPTPRTVWMRAGSVASTFLRR